MWARFGTKTENYGSGTEEEFFIAKSRKDRGEEVELMFYFKDEPILPSKLDPEQLLKVNQFKKSLGPEGVYYWTFNSIDNFERDFRRHLMDKIISYQERPVVEIKPERTQEIVIVESELGILDISEIIESEMPNLLEVMEDFSNHTNWLGERVTYHSGRINELNSSYFGSAPPSEMKRIINESAADMEKYADNVHSLSGNYLRLFNVVYKGYIDIFAFARNSVGDEDAVNSFIDSGISLKDTMVDTSQKLNGMLDQVRLLPRMTSRLNTAKRRVIEEVSTIIDEIRSAADQFDDVLSNRQN